MDELEKHKEKLKALVYYLPLLEAADFSAGEWVFPPDTADGATPIPFKVPSQLATNFFDMLHDTGWVVSFEWPEWIRTEEAQSLFAKDGHALESATVDQLSKMLTACVRRDRFSYGDPLLKDLESGLMTRLARRADALIKSY